jgi:hypothetical protein
MGSGFTPNTRNGEKLAAMAAILLETDAYADFVGSVVAAEGVEGMYFYGIDRRDLEANDESFPAAFVIWDRGPTHRWQSTQQGGTQFRFSGDVVLVLEADTPEEFAADTPGALNWIVEQCDAMVGEMEQLFGVGGRQDVSAHEILEGPFRERESGTFDYVSIVYRFELRT